MGIAKGKVPSAMMEMLDGKAVKNVRATYPMGKAIYKYTDEEVYSLILYFGKV